MDFVATRDFKSPYVISTGMPHKPTAIKMKDFKKGEIISGSMIKKNGKPAFVMYKSTIVVPLSCIKQVIVKDINAPVTSSAEGDTKTETKPRVVVDIKSNGKSVDKKKYFDGIIVGALVGFGATFLAEKKGWIAVPSQKNKMIGAGVGAVIGLYVAYRFLGKSTDKK
jgi:hypothetical protein